MDKVRDAYHRAGYSSPSALVADAIRHHLEGMDDPIRPWEPDREEILQRARAIVPQSDEREHLQTGELFTADAELETRFVAMVIDALGQTRPRKADIWTKDKFLYPPEERDRTMEQWTALGIKSGRISKGDLVKWDLPTTWIEDQ